MSYKYEKFEKLSDAVRAWESGETVYFKNLNSEYKPKDSEDEDFFSYSRYYRRIEVKPFECWAIVSTESEHLNIVSVGSEDFIKGYKMANYPDEKFQVIKLREVIE